VYATLLYNSCVIPRDDVLDEGYFYEPDDELTTMCGEYADMAIWGRMSQSAYNGIVSAFHDLMAIKDKNDKASVESRRARYAKLAEE